MSFDTQTRARNSRCKDAFDDRPEVNHAELLRLFNKGYDLADLGDRWQRTRKQMTDELRKAQRMAGQAVTAGAKCAPRTKYSKAQEQYFIQMIYTAGGVTAACRLLGVKESYLTALKRRYGVTDQPKQKGGRRKCGSEVGCGAPA